MQTSSLSGLRASPARENFVLPPTTTPSSFLRQNANILADAHFQREIERLENYLVAMRTKRDAVQQVVDDYVEQWLATASPLTELDSELGNYRSFCEILEEALNLGEGTLDLCRWMARQCTFRLQMDIDRYVELDVLRGENHRLTYLLELTDEALLNLGRTRITS